MINKNYLCVIIAIILALITALLILKPKKSENIQTPVSENVFVQQEEKEEVNNTAAETEKVSPQEDNKSETIVKKVKKQIPPETKTKPVLKTEIKKTEIDECINQRTDIDPELLKKDPRADVVIVDKEYKVRSSGKYIFK